MTMTVRSGFENFDPDTAELELKGKLREANDNKFVVTCSGGADSSYTLYLLKIKYKLDIIGANFDHGFQSNTAKENLSEMSRILNIPITIIRPNMEVLYRLCRDFILKTGEVCTPCCQGCCRSGFIVAENHNVKTIIHGGVSGSRIEFNVLGMFKHHYERFMKIVGDDYSSEELQDIVTPTDEIKKFNLISLPQYKNWDEKKIVVLLTKEVGWKTTPDGRIRHVDCTIVEAVEYLLQRKYGFSRKWMNTSANIRAGFIDTEEGCSLIKNQEGKLGEEPKEAFDILLEKIGLTRKQIYELPFYNSEPAVKFL